MSPLLQDAGSSLEGHADIPASGFRAAPPINEREALASAHEGVLKFLSISLSLHLFPE